MILFSAYALAVLAYLIGGALQGRALMNKPVCSRNLILMLGLAGAIAQAFSLSHTLITDNGLRFDFFITASLIACIIVLLALASILTRPLENLLVVIYPMAALTVILSALVPAEGQSHEYDPGLDLHIASSMIAYAFFTLALVQALLLSRQNWQLKHHKPSALTKALPPLMTMEKLLFELIWVGLIFLTIGLGSGFFFVENLFVQHLIHKTILSILAWFIFATLLVGHYRFGWRSRTAVRWTIGGFVVLMLSFFGTKLVLEYILHRA
ncbi:inner membrane protein YpjD [Pokkaliibacter plantistimulans]|uniref:cytochrome C assembly family protein n=1 Tax=Pokkaliibacter plantistimulans TaxID=1635171 RepID=UPI000D75014E|nr:cytochrome c biogenesis protein CcsA [Pokkaliibacter plantistimulans]